MEKLYTLTDAQIGVIATLPGSQAYLSPAHKALTEFGTMTAMCLMDALCDFEHSAGYRRGVKDAGGDPDTIGKGDPHGAVLGDLLGELRSDQGSYEVRQSVLDMVAAVDAAWERLDSSNVCFDLEFCPLAVRLRFEEGLTGDALSRELLARGHAAVLKATATKQGERG